METILVSACLLGTCCKYSGGHNRNEAVIAFLRGRHYIPVCPESLVLPRPARRWSFTAAAWSPRMAAT